MPFTAMAFFIVFHNSFFFFKPIFGGVHDTPTYFRVCRCRQGEWRIQLKIEGTCVILFIVSTSWPSFSFSLCLLSIVDILSSTSFFTLFN
ncbi:hypothetical protein BDV32DRAFT_82136 [Aspergillus pseudonomiae]|nr:hypothetical protein BDV32DRAFT_82136 [Aspergillus pseudonomiae]